MLCYPTLRHAGQAVHYPLLITSSPHLSRHSRTTPLCLPERAFVDGEKEITEAQWSRSRIQRARCRRQICKDATNGVFLMHVLNSSIVSGVFKPPHVYTLWIWREWRDAASVTITISLPRLKSLFYIRKSEPLNVTRKWFSPFLSDCNVHLFWENPSSSGNINRNVLVEVILKNLLSERTTANARVVVFIPIGEEMKALSACSLCSSVRGWRDVSLVGLARRI